MGADNNARALRVYGNLSTLELAPVLLAIDRFHPGPTVLEQGGISSLYGQPGDLPNIVPKGSSDVATNSETQALRYSVQQPGLRCILTLAEGVYRILARRSAGIRQLADLRGKRVGTMPRTSSAYYLDRTLRTCGLTQEDVEIVSYVAGTKRPLAMMTDALVAGEIDAMTIWEPEMQRAQDALGDELVEFPTAGGYRENFALFTTQEKLDDPALRRDIVAFVASVIEASAAIRQDPSRAIALVASAARFDEGLVSRAWPHHTFPGSLLANMLDVMAQEEVWVAKETGRAPRSRAALASLIDDSVLRDAMRGIGAPGLRP